MCISSGKQFFTFISSSRLEPKVSSKVFENPRISSACLYLPTRQNELDILAFLWRISKYRQNHICFKVINSHQLQNARNLELHISQDLCPYLTSCIAQMFRPSFQACTCTHKLISTASAFRVLSLSRYKHIDAILGRYAVAERPADDLREAQI